MRKKRRCFLYSISTITRYGFPTAMKDNSDDGVRASGAFTIEVRDRRGGVSIRELVSDGRVCQRTFLDRK